MHKSAALFRPLLLTLLFTLCYTRYLAQAERYIFYWNNIQATLDSSNQFAATVEVTRPQLLESVFSKPFMWSSATSKMVDPLECQFEGLPWRISKQEPQSEGANANLMYEKAMGVNVDQTFTISNIRLNDHRVGQITLRIIESPRKQPRRFFRMWPLKHIDEAPAQAALTSSGSVIWKGIDPDRQFYSVSEFMEIIRQQPEITHPTLTGEGLNIGIFLDSDDDNLIGINQLTRANAYESVVQEFQKRRPQIVPGLWGELFVEEYETGKKLLRHSFALVDDNAPMLDLRASQQHTVNIVWSNWNGRHDNLYLKSYEKPGGKKIYADQAQSWRIEYQPAQFPDDKKIAAEMLISSRPTFFVDGITLSKVSFTLTVDGTDFQIGPDQRLPDAAKRMLRSGTLSDDMIKISNIKSAEYDLGLLTYSILWPNFKRKCHDLPSCQQLPADPTIELSTPEVNEITRVVKVSFELQEVRMATVYLFNPEGGMAYFDTDRRKTGTNTITFPAGVFFTPGWYQIYLETEQGIAQKRFKMNR